MVFLIRSIHGVITLYFLTCIGLIYYSGITNRLSTWAYLAALSTVIEGLVVYFNHGVCPLGKLHHQFGDEKTFFELFVPPHLAKRAVPFFGVVTCIGVLMLVWNYFQGR